MKLVILADAHLEGLHDPSQAALVNWLDRLEADELVLLGDIFHHWWGFPGAVATEYIPVCAALLRLTGRGIPLTCLRGNHDFALGPFFRETLGACIRGPHARTIDGVTYYLAHGDEADRSYRYRTARAVIRSRPFAVLIRAIGPAPAQALLRRLAGASRDRPAEPARLLQAQRTWAAERIAEGARYVVLGHAHAPGLIDLGRGTVICAPDWASQRRWLEIRDGLPAIRGPFALSP